MNVLGVGVSAINMRQAMSTLALWIATGARKYVCVTGVHGVMECQRDPELRKIHNSAGMVTPDGMPLVWLGKLTGHSAMTRVYGPDLMLASCGYDATPPHRHYFFGGSPGVTQRLATRLVAKNPSLVICGMSSPPFRNLTAEEDADVVRQMNAAKPDIVWVGLGTPKQERWMAAHRGAIDAPVMIGVGAAFDFLSGAKRQAPVWMQRGGFEWLFRLAAEPRRLAGRYLINNPLFIAQVTLQKLGLLRFDLDGAP